MNLIRQKNIHRLITICCLLFVFTSTTQAQKQKVAVFAPLYLDSAFDAENNYRYNKNFPKFINPGLEFYEGVQLALDSLSLEKIELEVFINDTRSKIPLEEQALNLDSTIELIIAHATVQENWVLAAEAQKRKIPYININLPNDGGIYNNPYFIMLNPSLKTHVEGIYRYMQKYYSLNSITVLRKKGSMEDLIKNYIDEFGQTNAAGPLKLKYFTLPDSFSVKQLLPLLDSTRQNIFLAATLDEKFNRQLITQLTAAGRAYKTTLLGMPTYNNLEKDFTRSEYHGPEIIYTDPFYNPRTDKISVEIVNHFNNKFYARPTDMVIRGYETTLRFCHLLAKYKHEFAGKINLNEFKVIRDFDIQPVYNKQSFMLDYYENKKLYFIHWFDGAIRTVD